jgi:hypothetical protein
METKLACMQVEVSKETGEVMLLIETACGLRPVMGWPDINGMEDFAMALLGICLQVGEKDTKRR